MFLALFSVDRPSIMRFSNVSFIAAGLVTLLAAVSGTRAVAQPPNSRNYFPLDHRVPGRAAQWDRAIRPYLPEYVQPIRIDLPSVGLVSYFDGSADRNILTQAPSQVGMIVGKTYRLQISGMPEFPGVSLYPTIELLDRLHPPVGREQEFPIPIQFSTEEIESALEDQLVTKVIYLEQPQWAVPQEPGQPMHVDDLAPDCNLLQAADRRGRTMAIVRLGGRVPDAHGGNSQFYGELAPVITQLDRTSPADSWAADAPSESPPVSPKTEPAIVSIRD